MARDIASSTEKEIKNLKDQFDTYEKQVNGLTLDRMNKSPREEVEPQTKLSQEELSRKKDIYLKPHRSISSREKFNEIHRKSYDENKEYVQFVAENNEIIGEDIDIWTKPYPGLPAEWWKVPVNKPVWGPKYLCDQIKRCYYHRLEMQQSVTTGNDGMGQYYGALVADTTKQRLDSRPVSSTRPIFMGR